MEEANRVTAYLKVTAEFYDPEATPETVRYAVEQTLEDSGYEVDVDCVFPDEETFCQYMARNYSPPNADREKVIDMNGKLALDYLEKCWKEYFGKDNNVPCKSDVPAINAGKWIPVKDRLPDAAGVPVLVTAVNTYGQRHVFEAFQGYGDFKWYTLDVTKMKRDGSTNNEVGNGWTITHWMEMPEPAEES